MTIVMQKDIPKISDSTQDRTGDVLRVKQMPWPTRPSNQLFIYVRQRTEVSEI